MLNPDRGPLLTAHCLLPTTHSPLAYFTIPDKKAIINPVFYTIYIK